MNSISADAVFVGRKGAGLGAKWIVFGILERHGKGYTETVPKAAKKLLQIRDLGPSGP